MIRRLAMVMVSQKTIPDEIIYTYVAFLKNYNMVIKAIEKYYTEPTSYERAHLIQEIARPQAGTMSERIMKANEVMEKILDLYNCTQPIEHEKDVDIDWNDEVEEFVLKNKSTLVMVPRGPNAIKRIK